MFGLAPLPLHSSGICEAGRHKMCGGWACACDCHDDEVGDAQEGPEQGTHSGLGHAHRQVGRCVFCECGDRLYTGKVMSADSYKGLDDVLKKVRVAAQIQYAKNRRIIAEAKHERDKRLK